MTLKKTSAPSVQEHQLIEDAKLRAATRAWVMTLCWMLSAVCCLPAAADEPASGEPVAGLQAELTAEQPVFQLGEPMPIRATLRNVGTTPLRVWPWCRPLQPPRIVVRLGESATLDLGAAFAEQERKWVLWDAAGARVDSQYAPQTCHFSEDDLLLLAPGESWSLVEDVTTYYPVQTAGSYVVRARYEHSRGAAARQPDEWAGMVVTAPLSIQVTSE